MEELSETWVIETLMKKSLKTRLENDGDPFDSVLSEPHLLRDITDEHLGETFGHSSIRVSKKLVPGDIADGEQKITEKIVHRFNDDLFEKLTMMGEVGDVDEIKKWRDRVWKPIENLTRDIYEANPSPDDTKNAPREVSEEEYRKLGRILRRTIGE